MEAKKEKQTHIMIMFFGALSIIIGIYNIINGSSIQDQMSSIFIGVSLLGVGIISYYKLVDKNE